MIKNGQRKLVLTRKAQKDLDKLSNPTYSKIRDRLLDLSRNRSNLNIKKLTQQEGYRLRVGNYRVLFIHRNTQLIISRILHRKDSY